MSDNNDTLGRLLRIDAATALPGHSDGVPDPDISQRWGSLIAALKATDVIRLHSVTLHRQPNGEEAGVRVWVGTGDAQERSV